MPARSFSASETRDTGYATFCPSIQPPPSFLQNNVGTAGQFAVVQPEAVAHAVQEGPDNHFRFGIFGADSPHVTRVCSSFAGLW